MDCMNTEIRINTDECYRVAEKRAAHYFKSLYVQVSKRSYVATLAEDFQSWKHNHIHHHPVLSLFLRRRRKPDSEGYHTYIQWLDYAGKLDNYLDRSISYIFMRDLGKALDTTETQTRIRRVVDSLKNALTTNRAEKREAFSMAWLYRWAQKEGIESTIIWMMDKLKTVSSHIPIGMDAEQAQRKLIKIIAGVLLHVMEELNDELSSTERAQKLDEAIRLGYSYGLTYPFIDDLLDSEVLSDKEKKQYSQMIRTTLITGAVPELGEWTGSNANLIKYIHLELKEAFEYIETQQRPETRKTFFEEAYVFFHSQEVDRVKDLSNANYTNEDVYIPIILKSSSSRLIVRSVISAPEDKGFSSRTFFYGIYNQLADDFADMFDDMKAGSVTPYTYYMKYHDKRPDLINPFELYWTVISHLLHSVYHSDTKACEVILDRAINGLKRFKERVGMEKYNEVMTLFTTGNSKFNRMIQGMVRKADDVDFFDKLLRDHIITTLKNERREQEDFQTMIESVRIQINNILKIPKTQNDRFMNDPIIDAANYSLEGDGKRLRPIVTWAMGVNGYGLNQTEIVPLLRSLEYMHTASLIFDDLPSQDNASTRRGRHTLHMVYNTAIAELTGLFLTQKAIEEQASLEQFDSNTVRRLIHYSAQMTADMCKGQAMDLDSKGKQLSIEQLNRICFYKTGIAFEASLIMPAILANASGFEMEALKKYAQHAGIAFQIRDDLLDVEGDQTVLGKPIGLDAVNNHSTFVSVLGVAGARKEMWEHYCMAMESLQDVSRNTTFLKHLLNYFVNRNH
ncbi:polyprenyl synthetase family protein [Neobacillus sp. MM2021_6]|uniref:polyprenyl synthetase family protein n=1 Tax=Bacillaceae TaxID=186817 RepID=UPI001408AD5D|nr:MULTISPECIES: polyprenyl synthetase family protein [Bacillaceae]MBO0961881.1 polyprenyl synthetase family protein [Neobacillus sp. MM2021_6]NHC18952.1 polyprenyl synthetase family protein [Bacillus sp. MM2020_4]